MDEESNPTRSYSHHTAHQRRRNDSCVLGKSFSHTVGKSFLGKMPIPIEMKYGTMKICKSKIMSSRQWNQTVVSIREKPYSVHGASSSAEDMAFLFLRSKNYRFNHILELTLVFQQLFRY